VYWQRTRKASDLFLAFPPFAPASASGRSGPSGVAADGAAAPAAAGASLHGTFGAAILQALDDSASGSTAADAHYVFKVRCFSELCACAFANHVEFVVGSPIQPRLWPCYLVPIQGLARSLGPDRIRCV